MTTFTKSLAGSVTGAGGLKRQTAKALAGSSKPTGRETPVVVGGGTQELESGGDTLAIGGLLRGPP